MFSAQLRSSSEKNQIKHSSYVTVMPFTNHVIFSSREFRPPEKLEMTNLLSDEPTTNSIMPKIGKNHSARLWDMISDGSNEKWWIVGLHNSCGRLLIFPIPDDAGSKGRTTNVEGC
ncbi:hypothetical protein DY000_02024128 [Brassica cretica]|uniref:Uncharacterized protein n=1 Tax=Brassica cretica TaxID=69181 RepID=A0ABQ7EEC1_BRACR|nr:hypothetical protein DY000_02024128 [Brassica cretica]